MKNQTCNLWEEIVKQVATAAYSRWEVGLHLNSGVLLFKLLDLIIVNSEHICCVHVACIQACQAASATFAAGAKECSWAWTKWGAAQKELNY